MSNNYAKPLPMDKNQAPMQQFPAPFPAVVTAAKFRDNAVASSTLTLNQNTSEIEIGAIGGLGAVIRWIPLTETPTVSPYSSVIASGLGANFDHFIPAGWYRQFVVPKETQGLGTAPMQVGSTYGLYQRVAIINAGTTATSVLVSEF